jgi:hypothetical protein
MMKETMKFGIVPVITIFLTFPGCRSNFYSEKDFPIVPKFDAHVHIASDRGYFEEQAEKDNFNLLTINVDVSDSLAVKRQYDFAISSVRKHPGRVFYSPTFFFDTTGWGSEAWSKRTISELNNYISDGAVSVKLWKNIGMTLRDKNGKFIMIDDPGLDPVINFIVKKGLAVTGHLGEPRNCWLPLDEMTIKGDSDYFAANPKYHMYLHPDYPSYDDQIKARDHMLEKHPDLTFIGCHLGSLEWSVDELAKRLDRFPNMAVDMAARICHLQYQSLTDYKKVRDFCIRYQDRLIYGTDLADEETDNKEALGRKIHETWINDWRFFATDNEMTSNQFRGNFRALHLPGEVVDKIFYRNAVKWYKLNSHEFKL